MVLLAAIAGSSFVGSYFQGNGAGMNYTLDLQPNGTYRYEWQGCFDDVTAVGRFRVVGNEIDLSSASKTDPHDPVVRPPEVLVAIRWAPRTFLVPPDRLGEFCLRVRTGWRGADRWHDGRFFRDGEYPSGNRPAPALQGLPSVPFAYSRRVRQPLNPKLVRNIDGYVATPFIQPDGRHVVQKCHDFVTNVGSADGISPSMAFEGPKGEMAEIVDLRLHSSVCRWMTEERPAAGFMERGKAKGVRNRSTNLPSAYSAGTPLKLRL